MSENADAVIALDRKLLLVRLELVGEKLFAHARLEFAEIWGTAAELLPVVGERAAEQPLLEDWVSTAERLAGAGIDRRYPDAHPARCLRALSQIVIGWAAAAPLGARGTAFVGPGSAIPLWLGHALLLADVAATERIEWRRGSDGVELSRADGSSIGVVSTIDDDVRLGAGWQVVRLSSAAGIIVDTQTSAYAGDDAAGPPPRHLDRVLDRALSALEASARAMVTMTFKAATRTRPSAPWVAGLLRCDETLTAASLLDAAQRDHERRAARIQALLGRKNVSTLAAVLELGGNADVPRLTLRKTRPSDGERVEDWSAIDTLAPLPDDVVERLGRTAASPSEEGAAYLAAVCAYRLGRFEECGAALARCIAVDAEVEEYWHLLAFAERHLGHRDRFERLVFARERAL